MGLEELIIEQLKKEAKEEGHLEGRQEGRQEGREEGFAQGREEELKLAIRNMSRKGFLDQDILEISVDKLIDIKAKLGL